MAVCFDRMLLGPCQLFYIEPDGPFMAMAKKFGNIVWWVVDSMLNRCKESAGIIAGGIGLMPA